MVKKLSTLPILTLFALTEPLQAVAQQEQPPTTPQPPPGYFWHGPWHMWSDGYSSPYWWIGPLFMIFFAVLCMAMMFFMMSGRMMHRPRGHHALDLLKERFARGEINQTEYEERKRLLEV